jgi:uncharacterized protein YjbJ (UPF0337 family)
MDKDRIKGSVRQAKGTLKEVLGTVQQSYRGRITPRSIV